MKQNDNQTYLTKKTELIDSTGGVALAIQVKKRSLFQKLGLPTGKRCATWLRDEPMQACCDCCSKESEQCQPFRVDGMGEALVCETCKKVFQAPLIDDKTIDDVVSFVNTIGNLAKDERKLVPENPKLTQRVIEFAYLVDGERLNKQFKNDSRQIARLFQLVRDGKASQGQWKKAVAFAMNVASLFGYEPFSKSDE